MSTKQIFVESVGPITVNKRRRARNLRLSLTPKGLVRITMPYWLPYAAAEAFALKKRDWIIDQQQNHSVGTLNNGDRIGKSHRIQFIHDSSLSAANSRVNETVIRVASPRDISDISAQNKLVMSSEKALKQEAEALLPQRLDYLAQKNSLSYKDVKIRKLTSRWGSCSSKKSITLSYFLMQLPWYLIDYVLLHELTHTKHMHHGKNFWQEMEQMLPSAKKLKKELNVYKPRILPNP